MLDFVDANQQSNNVDLHSDFEFAMPVSSTHDSFRKSDGTATSPADELFYRGQLLPLLLPCRLKMVQELYDSKTEPCFFSSGDADPPCKNASCTKGPPVRLLDMLTTNHEEHTLHKEKHRPNAIGVIVSKPRLRWNLIFPRGKKCSLMEAACCHFIRAKCTLTNEEAPAQERSNTGICGSSVLRSGSYKGDTIPSPKIMKRAASSLSSAMHRNSSQKSCNGQMSTKRVQKQSLVLRARDCLQRSLKVFKLRRLIEQKGASNHQQRASLLKQHDYRCVQNTTLASAAKNRRQVAHCDSRSNSCFRFEYEDVHGDMQMHPYTEVDDDDDLSTATFITMEPSAFMPENLGKCPYDHESCLAPPSTWGSLNNNDTAANIDLQNSVQGAIAHCKGSM